MTMPAKRLLSRLSASAVARPKRFYKDVLVTDKPRDKGNVLQYGLLLDNRELKTPAGNKFELNSKALAAAVGKEWASQEEHINAAEMRLTGLAYTYLDNPFKVTTESIVETLVNQLDTDTLLYFVSDPVNLLALQQERWAPIIRQVNALHGLDLRATQHIADSPSIPEESRKRLAKWLQSRGLSSLIGLQYAAEATKSVLLALAASAYAVEVEDAVNLARLEQTYQTATWGNVEWAHNVDYHETCARLAAGILFAQLSSPSLRK